MWSVVKMCKCNTDNPLHQNDFVHSQNSSHLCFAQPQYTGNVFYCSGNRACYWASIMQGTSHLCASASSHGFKMFCCQSYRPILNVERNEITSLDSQYFMTCEIVPFTFLKHPKFNILQVIQINQASFFFPSIDIYKVYPGNPWYQLQIYMLTTMPDVWERVKIVTNL
jgi:hypothetical protein